MAASSRLRLTVYLRYLRHTVYCRLCKVCLHEGRFRAEHGSPQLTPASESSSRDLKALNVRCRFGPPPFALSDNAEPVPRQPDGVLADSKGIADYHRWSTNDQILANSKLDALGHARPSATDSTRPFFASSSNRCQEVPGRRVPARTSEGDPRCNLPSFQFDRSATRHTPPTTISSRPGQSLSPDSLHKLEQVEHRPAPTPPR